MRALKANGVRVIATATTVGEARHLASAGVDAVIAQGTEAGGHRGTFAAPVEQSQIGTMALVPQIVDAVSVPVIAAGGIMDGRGIAAARCSAPAAYRWARHSSRVPRRGQIPPTSGDSWRQHQAMQFSLMSFQGERLACCETDLSISLSSTVAIVSRFPSSTR
jgi:hypothetical protein